MYKYFLASIVTLNCYDRKGNLENYYTRYVLIDKNGSTEVTSYLNVVELAKTKQLINCTVMNTKNSGLVLRGMKGTVLDNIKHGTIILYRESVAIAGKKKLEQLINQEADKARELAVKLLNK